VTSAITQSRARQALSLIYTPTPTVDLEKPGLTACPRGLAVLGTSKRRRIPPLGYSNSSTYLLNDDHRYSLIINPLPNCGTDATNIGRPVAPSG
jgi:hypothetical protein